jgi:hypothetical protein
MAVTLSSLAGAATQFFDNNGVPLAGGLIYTYTAGTTTPATTYTSSTGLIAHANPIVLDAAGRIATGEVWLTTGVDYKFLVKTSANVQLGSYDNIPSINDFTSIYADLSNNSNPALGDALIGFRQSNSAGNLSNAVGRTVHQKLQETISVQDFGAVGDGVTDDSPAFQAAADYLDSVSGGRLYIPSGSYLLNSTVNFAFSSILVYGATMGSKTTIINGSSNSPAFLFGDRTNTYGSVTIRDLTFGAKSGITPVYNCCAIEFSKLLEVTIDNILISNFPASLYNALIIEDCLNLYGSNVRVNNCLSDAVRIKGCTDTNFTSSRSDNNTGVGWYFENCGGIYFESVTAFGNSTAYYLGPGSGIGNRQAFFSQCIGDSSVFSNWVISSLFEGYFSQCWGSTQDDPFVNTSSVGFFVNGAAVSDVDNLIFSDCIAILNNSHGFQINKAQNIKLNGGSFGNSLHANGRSRIVGATPGSINNGIDIQPAAINIELYNVTCVNNRGYGIGIGVGATNVTITGGLVSNNTTGVIGDPANARNIKNVTGFNPFIPITPVFPASNTPLVNTTGTDCFVYFPSSGTVTEIQVDGLFLFTSPPATVYLPSGSSITVIYTVAPLWRWLGA